MINQLELENFKCFNSVSLPLGELTLLTGANASGKSSVLQVLVLLHQSINENEWASRLMLNGAELNLGCVADVVNKVHGRRDFGVKICRNEETVEWQFSGERAELSMAVDNVTVNGRKHKEVSSFCKLLPTEEYQSDSSLVNVLQRATYITAERLGPREYYKLDDPMRTPTVGSIGEHAVSILQTYRDKKIANNLVISSEPPNLLRQVEARMRQFFPGCGLTVDPVTGMNAVTLGIRTSDSTDFHRPINVGFGLTQILPIIIATLSAEPGELILIENPEVHLHPAGQAMMGHFLAEVAATGVQLIVESHSDHVLNGIRRGVKVGTIEAERVSIQFFQNSDDSSPQVFSPRLTPTGKIDFWPSGFFDQFDKDLSYLADLGK